MPALPQVLSACGSNSSLCWDTVYLLVRPTAALQPDLHVLPGTLLSHL